MTPLRSKTTAFKVDGRKANLALARALLWCASVNREPCTVLDIDALYSSNSGSLFGWLPPGFSKTVEITVPEPGSNLDSEIASLTGSARTGVTIIDSLNSLYHMLAAWDRRAGTRKVSLIIAFLSYLARANRGATMFTLYRRENPSRTGGSISELADVTVSVQLHGSKIRFECDRGMAWSGGVFSLPTA